MDNLGMMEGDLGVMEDDLGMMEDDLRMVEDNLVADPPTLSRYTVWEWVDAKRPFLLLQSFYTHFQVKIMATFTKGTSTFRVLIVQIFYQRIQRRKKKSGNWWRNRWNYSSVRIWLKLSSQKFEITALLEPKHYGWLGGGTTLLLTWDFWKHGQMMAHHIDLNKYFT